MNSNVFGLNYLDGTAFGSSHHSTFIVNIFFLYLYSYMYIEVKVGFSEHFTSLVLASAIKIF